MSDNVSALMAGVPFGGYYYQDVNQTGAISGVALEVESEPPPPLTVDPPIASPQPGDYQVSVTITLLSPDTSKYTTDGSPAKTSPTAVIYTVPFTRTVNTTVRAYSFQDDIESDEVEFAYTVIPAPPPPPNPPTASPIPGSYQNSVTVALQATSADTIKYTSNFDDPKISGITYTAPFALNASARVRTYVIRGDQESVVVNFDYTITIVAPPPSPPVPSVPPGSYQEQITVALTAQQNDVIKFTTNGSNPVILGVIYVAPISLTADTVLRTCAVRGAEVSEVATYSYVITLPQLDLLELDIPVDHPRALVVPYVDRVMNITNRLDVL